MAKRRATKPVFRETVAWEHAGKTYTGHYHVEHEVVVVDCAYGSKATQQGRLTAEHVARRLLAEMVLQGLEP